MIKSLPHFSPPKSHLFFSLPTSSLLLLLYLVEELRSLEIVDLSFSFSSFFFLKKNLLNLFSLYLNGDWVESRCLATSQPVLLWFIFGEERSEGGVVYSLTAV